MLPLHGDRAGCVRPSSGVSWECWALLSPTHGHSEGRVGCHEQPQGSSVTALECCAHEVLLPLEIAVSLRF